MHAQPKPPRADVSSSTSPPPEEVPGGKAADDGAKSEFACLPRQKRPVHAADPQRRTTLSASMAKVFRSASLARPRSWAAAQVSTPRGLGFWFFRVYYMRLRYLFRGIFVLTTFEVIRYLTFAVFLEMKGSPFLSSCYVSYAGAELHTLLFTPWHI